MSIVIGHATIAVLAIVIAYALAQLKAPQR